MEGSKFIACDFGAGSGRVMLARVSQERVALEEVHRFINREVNILGTFYWDLPNLFAEMKEGLRKLGSSGHQTISGIGVDTWGVDFGLIAEDGSLLGLPTAYRDKRTDGMMELAFERISRKELYEATGIQFLQLNTVFQLLSMVYSKSSVLASARRLLFMPDMFNYMMTGEETTEYSIASTSQLLNAATRGWEPKVFEALGLPIRLMGPITKTGSRIGSLLPELCEEVGLNSVDVIAPPSHDTASAVVAVPAESGRWAYLSSGTWSLLGVEVDEPIITDLSLKNNFTNEGGYAGKIRFLKNSMGLWILERCRLAWAQEGISYSYQDLIDLAAEAQAFRSTIDPDNHTFFNPVHMPKAISEYCNSVGQPVPESHGEILRCVFESLAFKYRFILDQINSMVGNPVEVLHIVGGGSQNHQLNQYTAEAIGIPVVAGPVEATAIGNVMVQAITTGLISDLEEARRVISNSFELRRFEPIHHDLWDSRYREITHLLE